MSASLSRCTAQNLISLRYIYKGRDLPTYTKDTTRTNYNWSHREKAFMVVVIKKVKETKTPTFLGNVSQFKTPIPTTSSNGTDLSSSSTSPVRLFNFRPKKLTVGYFAYRSGSLELRIQPICGLMLTSTISILVSYL